MLSPSAPAAPRDSLMNSSVSAALLQSRLPNELSLIYSRETREAWRIDGEDEVKAVAGRAEDV